MKSIELKCGAVVLVDDEDERLLEDHHWWISERGYVVADIDSKRVRLHRLVLGPERGEVVDHIDGDKLNNVKANLRRCHQRDNARNAKISMDNTTGFKGVSRFRGRFRAYITVNRKQKHLGLFDDPGEAHAAYCKAADELHGAFARHN